MNVQVLKVWLNCIEFVRSHSSRCQDLGLFKMAPPKVVYLIHFGYEVGDTVLATLGVTFSLQGLLVSPAGSVHVQRHVRTRNRHVRTRFTTIPLILRC